jgi:hypothetical protein
VRFGCRSAAIAAVVVAMLGLTGCGGGSSSTGNTATDGITSSVGRYVTALAKHDAAGACNVVTAAYWSATATELVSQLRAKAYADLATDSCQQGLKRIFSGSKTTGSVPKFAVSNVRVQGHTAIAHLTLGKATSDGSVANSRFVKAPTGVWQIDCCTGSQLAKHPPNLPG